MHGSLRPGKVSLEGSALACDANCKYLRAEGMLLYSIFRHTLSIYAVTSIAAVSLPLQLVLAQESPEAIIERANRVETIAESRPVTQDKINFIVNALQDESPTVRFRAALAFKSIMPTGKAALPALHQSLLQDEDYYVRYCAAIALGLIGPQQDNAIDFLLLALSDPHPRVRMGVLHSLEMYGKSALPAVARLRDMQANDVDMDVKNFAHKLLQRLEGFLLLP